ncbi:MAG: hypothetical protein M3Q07_04270 [Pseudobdellovibrionaceae bacterium]|nr:hypothetical protein [Pseudobdellovibrionaceae bacterium]
MQRVMPGLLMIYLAASACQKENSESPVEATPAVNTAEQQPVTQEPAKKEPVKPIVMCDTLEIPSYELWIKDLSANHCDSCHNERIAFNGIKFLTYEDWQATAAAAKNRIANNLLTKPLDPIVQGIFLKWFEKGMPRTEKDCQDKG